MGYDYGAFKLEYWTMILEDGEGHSHIGSGTWTSIQVVLSVLKLTETAISENDDCSHRVFVSANGDGK